MAWWRRALNVVRSERVNDELDDELQFHLEATADRLTSEGLTRADAEREARRRLGNHTALRERSRDVKLLPWLDAIIRDVTFGARMLRKDLAATGAAAISLGLALGAVAAAFMLVDALILRTLPVRDPAGLVYLALPPVEQPRAVDSPPPREGTSFSYPLFERMKAAAKDRAELMVVGHQGMRQARFADAPDHRERVRAQHVSGNFFGQLGIVPALGRVLMPADDRRGSAKRVAVLSHAFWSRRFGADPAVVGRVFTLDRDEQFEIVGVAREGFTGVEPGFLTDFWIPATTFTAEALTAEGWQWFRIWGRLAEGVTAAEIGERLQPIFRQFRRERAARRPADTPADVQARYINQPLVARSAANGPSSLRLDFERPLLVLTAIVALVLLLACSNVANLLLGRAAAREREMALRLSIGAGRARLVQQLLVESALLAAVASALGAIFAAIAAPSIIDWLAPANDPAYLDLRFDLRAAGMLALLAVAATLLFGLAPAIRASAASPIDALRSAGRHTLRARLLQPLLTAQVASGLAVVFLATLLLLSFLRLASIDPGFRADGVLLADVETVSEVDREEGRRALIDLLARMRSLSGVTSASASSWPLLIGSGWMQEIRMPGGRLDNRTIYYLEVSPGFMQTMGIALRGGRDFVDRDMDAAEPTAVIVNETFARLYFADGPAVGRVFERPGGAGEVTRQEVVGVVADAKYDSLREGFPPTVYLPLRPRRDATLQLRTALDPGTLARRLREEAARSSPALALTDLTLQSTVVTNTLLRERLLAVLSTFFGLVSLALAAVGLYGVLTFTVVQRTREIGIRRALGASRRTAVARVLADASLYGGLGGVLGVAVGIYGARFLKVLLYDVEPLDPPSLLLPVAALLAVGIVAAVVPARRAASVDPAIALRDE